MSDAKFLSSLFPFIILSIVTIAVVIIMVVAKDLFGNDETPKSSGDLANTSHDLPTSLNGDRGSRRIKPEAIGKVGEMVIKTALGKKYQLPNKYILSNVLIPTKNGGTTEIDVIAITSRGVLVFECKNMAGNIYGDVKAKKWLQYIGKEINTFPNPFHQNYGHLKALEALLEKTYGDVPIYCFFVPTERGKWHINNLRETDYVLGKNISLKDFMRKTPVSEVANSSAGALVEFLSGFQASEFSMEMHKKYVATKHHH